MKLFKKIDFDWVLVMVSIASMLITYFSITDPNCGEEISIDQCEIIFNQLED
jgi:hypothetical protein